MLTLYYYPAYSSLCVHVALCEAGLPYRLVKVDLQAKVTETGEDYLKINDKGSVPALRLPDGSILTETAALLLYVADAAQQPSNLAPVIESAERYQLYEWLNFLASEIHKREGMIVSAVIPDSACALVREQLFKKYDWINARLEGRDYLMGKTFTVADAHLFFLLHGLVSLLSVPLDRWPNLDRVFNAWVRRSSVRQALQREGLVSSRRSMVANSNLDGA